MSSTTFVDQVTPVPASWLNDVNTTSYTTVPALSTTVTGLGTSKANAGANTDITSLASPAIASATATTQTAGDNTTKVATTAFVTTAVGAVPSGAAIQGTFKNLAVSSTGLSANVLVSCDEIVVENSSNAYQTLRSVSLTIAGTTTGANALDTGTIAASTWYSVWVIWNGTTTAGLLSTSATAPTMPSGYTHKARVGWIRTDGTANKYPLGFKQYGRKARYLVASGANVPNMPLIGTGTAGNPATPTWVSLAVSNYVPTTASLISLSLLNPGSGTKTTVAPNNSYGGYNSSTNPPVMQAGAASVANVVSICNYDMMLESSNIYWASDGSGTLAVAGWEDNL